MSDSTVRPEESTRDRMVAALEAGIPRTASALATELGWRVTSVRSLISRMRREGVPIESSQKRRNLPAEYSMQTPNEHTLTATLVDALAALHFVTDSEFESIVASLRSRRELGLHERQ